MPVCVLTRVTSDSSYSQSVPNLAMLGTTRRATNSRACQLCCVQSNIGSPAVPVLPGVVPSIARLAPLGCATGLTSRVGMRAPDRVGSASYLPPIWLLLAFYLARIWRLSPLHFAQAIKKAERKLSVTTVPLVELASEGARKPLVLLVQPAQRRIIYDFSICCLNRGRARPRRRARLPSRRGYRYRCCAPRNRRSRANRRDTRRRAAARACRARPQADSASTASTSA